MCVWGGGETESEGGIAITHYYYYYHYLHITFRFLTFFVKNRGQTIIMVLGMSMKDEAKAGVVHTV